MTRNTRNPAKIFCLVVLIGLVFIAPAQAAIRANASLTADEDGLSLSYMIPIVGIGTVNLTKAGDTDTINIRFLTINIADVELELLAINADNETLDLQVSATTPLTPEEPFESIITVPFGTAELGVVANLLGQLFMPVGNHDIDISVLISRLRTRYEANVDLPPIVEDLQLEGQAVDNQVDIEIPDVADLSFILEPGNLFTQVTYSFKVQVPEIPGGGEGEGVPDLGIPPIEGGPVVVPNGSYHIWIDLDMDLEKLLM